MYVPSITAVRALTPAEGANEASSAAAPAPTGSAPGVSFGDLFTQAVHEANETDRTAATKVDALARGANDDLHGTMIAVKEADISIKLVGTIRNKLLDAFQEIWKTSV